MNKKYQLLTFVSYVSILVGILWHFSTSDSISSIPVSWNAADMPLVPLVIEGERYYVLFNFGSSFDLTLNKEVLDSIADKQFAGSAWPTDLNGETKEVPSYAISKSLLGSLPLANIVAIQTDEIAKHIITYRKNSDNVRCEPKISGNIGRGVLQRTNWLLDFAHSTVIPCNSQKQLEERGYCLGTMNRVPFEILKHGEVAVMATTCTGPLKLQLMTGTSLSLIQKSLIQESDCQCDTYGLSKFHSKKFVLGEKDFGEQSFFPFNLPQGFAETDGFLGMDFLRAHIVYVDYSSKSLYIQ